MKTLVTLCLLITASTAAAHGSTLHGAKDKAKARAVEIAVTENGFEPTPIKVKKGEPLKLVVTRKTDKTCATEIVIKEAGVKVALPLNKPVEVPFTPAKAGEIKYGCGMDMMVSAVLFVE